MNKYRNSRRPGGFSMVELMVGIVIAMAAVIVVMQVFKLSEGTRRTTSGGDDAQTTGAVSLAMLQRDLRQAGQGLSNLNLLGCNLNLPAPASWTANALGPVTINHADFAGNGSDADQDTLLVAYGTGLGSPDGDRINSQASTTVYSVATATAFRLGERIIATPATRATPCELTLDKVSTEPASPTVTVATGMAGAANGALYNLGDAPRLAAYAVRGGHLAVCDFLNKDCRASTTSNWAEIADGVVAMRVQYGRDTSASMDAVVDTWDQTTPTTACGWMRTKAIRLVLVVRNGQYEKDAEVTTSEPTWSGSDAAPIKLSGDWKHYRYKTFESTLPLRNMAWQGVVTGC